MTQERLANLPDFVACPLEFSAAKGVMGYLNIDSR